jgi:hypothetical protein
MSCTRCNDHGYVRLGRRDTVYPCLSCNSPKLVPSKLVRNHVYTKEGEPDVTISEWNNGQFRFNKSLFPLQWVINKQMDLQEAGYAAVD